MLKCLEICRCVKKFALETQFLEGWRMAGRSTGPDRIGLLDA